ncbi:phosphofructokinase family protein [Cryptosporidium andersoni]|uniref:Probable ATP-dependent 6-phosphofructokinase n=1 Tax=Cryptosporidium andersoni TaxID=117008 RepID=A0A1J4MDN8_9CRYT|nr:phosphofructokinase family protein [Cryptosporidium andersoni]
MLQGIDGNRNKKHTIRRLRSLAVILEDTHLDKDRSSSTSMRNHEIQRPLRRRDPDRTLTTRLDSFKLSMGGKPHLHSADLFENFSPVQLERQFWVPTLPLSLSSTMVDICEIEIPDLIQKDADILKKLLPHTFGGPCVEIIQSNDTTPNGTPFHALRVGIVLSGGPAPGGHNVIGGVYDFIKSYHPDSQLFGFLGGLDGLFKSTYKIVSQELMDRFRNQGGFDMLWSGRGRINNEQDLENVREVCEQLQLHGLIIAGGDGSNSNAALIADYMAKHNNHISVVGVPKTIDGDLKNPAVEVSFGFDTAARTYAECVGNLCSDICTSQNVYHFVRVMGRSASHLALEVALQTRPNMVFIAEEVEQNGITLFEIVKSIVDLIETRAKIGKMYGIILIPEGLIEFIPEMKILIEELNDILDKMKTRENILNNEVSSNLGINSESIDSKVYTSLEPSSEEYDREIARLLSPSSANIWEYLPETIREQLLIDREATGQIQVAKIATERLLILLVEAELHCRHGYSSYYDLQHYRTLVKKTDKDLTQDSNKLFDNADTSICTDSPIPTQDDILSIPYSFTMMHHYLGYEGRCAMPSNFDANYCYALGHCAAALVYKGMNGYLALIRNLEENPINWQACGISITRIMEIKKSRSDDSLFAAVTRQLVDLNGPMFQLLKRVRNIWAIHDLYRAPGPLQFEGPCSDSIPYIVKSPTIEDLLCGEETDEKLLSEGIGAGVSEGAMTVIDNNGGLEGNVTTINGKRGVFNRISGTLSPLQLYRTTYRPPLPLLLTHLKARCKPTTQYNVSDPLIKRQIISCYPHLCNDNHFYCQEVQLDLSCSEPNVGLRIGILLLSRQTPGIANVVWGLYHRLRMVRGRCLGFYGVKGFLQGKHITLTEKDVDLLPNQGGSELIGRTYTECLVSTENLEKARQVCESLHLDGLVLCGSAFGMTQSAILTEYFLQHNCNTKIVGVPATASNNLTNDLVETCVGFDSSTKLYASLIGNVLTDAASMPKYWHFIRLMGRQPSNEVLECALQTHPNVVIIAEEYGAADKTLVHIVEDVADVICKRAEFGKNFGTVLIPDALLSHLPDMKILISEINELRRHAEENGQQKLFMSEMMRLGYTNISKSGNINGNINSNEKGSNGNSPMTKSPSVGSHINESVVSNNSQIEENPKYSLKMTPWSQALFKSLPRFIRKEILSLDVDSAFSAIETEALLVLMIKKELRKRKQEGKYNGNFQPFTHFFGYQGRSAMPSQFDSKLGYALGHFASIVVESGLTGQLCSIRGLCGEVSDWRMTSIPFNCLMRIVPSNDETHPELPSNIPTIPSSEVDLKGKAYRWLKIVQDHWAMQDRFCNPGPIQFDGPAANFYFRTLHEQQSEYYEMLKHVQNYAELVRETCTFGVNESFLKTAFVTLNGLLNLRYRDNNLLASLPDIGPFILQMKSQSGQLYPSSYPDQVDHTLNLCDYNSSSHKLHGHTSIYKSQGTFHALESICPSVEEGPWNVNK